MKPWLRRTIGILTLGGSFVGVTVAFQFLLGGTQPLVGNLITLAFVATYGWGVWVGLRLIEQAPRASDMGGIYWLLQVPQFSSPLAGYLFSSGTQLFVQYTVGASLGISWQLGSRFEYSLLESGKPWTIGINLGALAIAFVLYADSLRKPRVDAASDVEATPAPGE
jgi:hypothetical protein